MQKEVDNLKLLNQLNQHQNEIEKIIKKINNRLEYHFSNILSEKFSLYITFLSGDGFHINYGDWYTSLYSQDFFNILDKKIKEKGKDYKCKDIWEFFAEYIEKCRTF